MAARSGSEFEYEEVEDNEDDEFTTPPVASANVTTRSGSGINRNKHKNKRGHEGSPPAECKSSKSSKNTLETILGREGVQEWRELCTCVLCASPCVDGVMHQSCAHVLCNDCWTQLAVSRGMRIGRVSAEPFKSCPSCRATTAQSHWRRNLHAEAIAMRIHWPVLCGKLISGESYRTHQNNCVQCLRKARDEAMKEKRQALTSMGIAQKRLEVVEAELLLLREQLGEVLNDDAGSGLPIARQLEPQFADARGIESAERIEAEGRGVLRLNLEAAAAADESDDDVPLSPIL